MDLRCGWGQECFQLQGESTVFLGAQEAGCLAPGHIWTTLLKDGTDQLKGKLSKGTRREKPHQLPQSLGCLGRHGSCGARSQARPAYFGP